MLYLREETLNCRLLNHQRSNRSNVLAENRSLIPNTFVTDFFKSNPPPGKKVRRMTAQQEPLDYQIRLILLVLLSDQGSRSSCGLFTTRELVLPGIRTTREHYVLLWYIHGILPSPRPAGRSIWTKSDNSLLPGGRHLSWKMNMGVPFLLTLSMICL
jgi:hypothetical protein